MVELIFFGFCESSTNFQSTPNFWVKFTRLIMSAFVPRWPGARINLSHQCIRPTRPIGTSNARTAACIWIASLEHTKLFVLRASGNTWKTKGKIYLWRFRKSSIDICKRKRKRRYARAAGHSWRQITGHFSRSDITKRHIYSLLDISIIDCEPIKTEICYAECVQGYSGYSSLEYIVLCLKVNSDLCFCSEGEKLKKKVRGIEFCYLLAQLEFPTCWLGAPSDKGREINGNKFKGVSFSPSFEVNWEEKF